MRRESELLLTRERKTEGVGKTKEIFYQDAPDIEEK